MRTLITLCFVLFAGFVAAQNENLKHDNIWLTGYSSTPGQPEFGGTVIDFSNDTLESYYEFRNIDFEISNTTMCNEEGELIFSTNNEVVANKFNNIMINGDDLNLEESHLMSRFYFKLNQSIRPITKITSEKLKITKTVFMRLPEVCRFSAVLQRYNLHKHFRKNCRVGMCQLELNFI